MSNNYMKCPFCGYEVEHGLSVCRGCQAEIYYPNESALDTFLKYAQLFGAIAASFLCIVLTIVGMINGSGTSSIIEAVITPVGLIGICIFIWKTNFKKRKPEFRRTFRER